MPIKLQEMAGCAANACHMHMGAASSSASIDVYDTCCDGYCKDNEGQEDRHNANDGQRILQAQNYDHGRSDASWSVRTMPKSDALPH